MAKHTAYFNALSDTLGEIMDKMQGHAGGSAFVPLGARRATRTFCTGLRLLFGWGSASLAAAPCMVASRRLLRLLVSHPVAAPFLRPDLLGGVVANAIVRLEQVGLHIARPSCLASPGVPCSG